jgi:hypothetical protein
MECRPPSRRRWQPCRARWRTRSARFIRMVRPAAPVLPDDPRPHDDPTPDWPADQLNCFFQALSRLVQRGFLDIAAGQFHASILPERHSDSSRCLVRARVHASRKSRATSSLGRLAGGDRCSFAADDPGQPGRSRRRCWDRHYEDTGSGWKGWGVRRGGRPRPLASFSQSSIRLWRPPFFPSTDLPAC